LSLVLVRIDDRLIHGQVVEGWLRVVQADRIVVVSDEAAADPIQSSLMSMAVPSEVRVLVIPVESAARSLLANEWEKDRVLLLLPSPREARRLAEAGVSFDSVNVGGLHDAPGRKFITSSLALSDQDREDLQVLLDKKIFIETRTLPNDERRSILNFLSQNGRTQGAP
jgi:mannose/fructose/N-acetylgalactosamine-specific phosphotransferase system component IIB